MPYTWAGYLEFPGEFFISQAVGSIFEPPKLAARFTDFVRYFTV
jgi:hypothetical protein